MSITRNFGRAKVKYFEGSRLVEYLIEVDGKRVIFGTIHKDVPGWANAWSTTLAALLETARVIEDGTGLQSRAFQRSPSTGTTLYTELNRK